MCYEARLVGITLIPSLHWGSMATRPRLITGWWLQAVLTHSVLTASPSTTRITAHASEYIDKVRYIGESCQLTAYTRAEHHTDSSATNKQFIWPTAAAVLRLTYGSDGLVTEYTSKQISSRPIACSATLRLSCRLRILHRYFNSLHNRVLFELYILLSGCMDIS